MILSGCAAQTLPIPLVYQMLDPNPLELVPESRRLAQAEVIYITDRRPAQLSDKRYAHYTSGRSTSKAVGVGTVDMGAESWDQLVARDRLRRPRLVGVREIARYTSIPIPLVEIEGSFVPDPEREAVSAAAREQLHELLAEMMLPEDEGRVTVFVHGFNVPFESAVVTAAELAELTGRRGLVIVYSWPAGSGSLLFGYTHDRESGEFSVLHLRRTLREIAASPHVRQLNLIAHSRGTDVLTTALRELNLEERAAGRSTRQALKLGHLILAAPDLDLEVVGQRIAAEYLHMVPVSTTVYFSSRDRALGIANWLFHGISRLGRMDIDRLDEETRRAVSDLPPEIELVDVRSISRGLGHSYFHQSPEVSSDLYLILVEDRRIGAAHGRPLHKIRDGIWRLESGYPLTGTPAMRITGSDAELDSLGAFAGEGDP
jgi:esterase/lipase superfamily enzyme